MNFSTVYTQARSRKTLSHAQTLIALIEAQEAWAQSLDAAQLVTAFKGLAKASSQERLVKGFALTREAARRSLGLRHFAVQLVGGVVLLEGKLAEMRTGEGKTLTITAPAAVLALQGQGVHVVTANSYLAKRDAELMRPVYETLGLTVGHIDSDQTLADKQAAYQCDITYGVGSEFGFDYLKDHLVDSADKRVQRGHHAAIVDEVDSILVDEARVPMIISDRAADVSEVVTVLNSCVRELQPGVHYHVNLKERTAPLTEVGYQAVEGALVEAGVLTTASQLYDTAHLHWVRRLHSAVKAYALFRKDRDYVIQSGEVVLVDTGTGRKMQGRRLEDGLHEALEAREGVEIQRGTVTKATVTYQNFFGLYAHLAGLSGTALTDAEEFSEIYRLETVVIPPNRPVQRAQAEDLVYLTKAEKFAATVELARQRSAAGQPVLIGVATIRDAEVVDRLLTAAHLPHEMLTAKHIEREAHTIAMAGRPGAITVATNMAGRGTDILLGGEKPVRADFADENAFAAAQLSWEQARDAVRAAGGLFVLGTERNGLRRVDNQLAGRSGRQGDPGQVQFLLSLEDELLQTFGRSSQMVMMRKMLEASGSALGGATVAKLVTAAQQAVENQGFSARKSLMQFDQVLADQRKAVFVLRDALLEGDARAHVEGSVSAAVSTWVERNFLRDPNVANWPAADLKRELLEEFGVNVPLLGWVGKDALEPSEMARRVEALCAQQLATELPDEQECLRLALETLDTGWAEHLTALGDLRQAVSLKSKTGFNPVYQYHKDAFELFQVFEEALSRQLAAAVLSKSRKRARAEAEAAKQAQREAAEKVVRALEQRWVPRNEACPCGSGKRFRECHGKLS